MVEFYGCIKWVSNDPDSAMGERERERERGEEREREREKREERERERERWREREREREREERERELLSARMTIMTMSFRSECRKECVECFV